MKQPIKKLLPTPTGWLVSPTRESCLLFISDPKSLLSCASVMTQLWYCTEKGIPTRLKNIRKLDFENALETWKELQSNGWKLIERQINDS